MAGLRGDIPSNLSMGPGEVIRRKLDDSGFEGYTPAGGGSATIAQAIIDFGSADITDEVFNIIDASISTSSNILAFVTWCSALSRDPDEVAADQISISVEPLTGSMNIYASAIEGTVSGKYAINYQIG